jgi:cell division protein FtsB
MRKRGRFELKNAALVSGLSIAAVWLGFMVVDLAHKADIAWTAAQEAKAQASSLSARQAQLTAEIADLHSARGQDAAIRTAFDVARPGEEVIIVVPPATTTATVTPSWWDQHFGWLGL